MAFTGKFVYIYIYIYKFICIYIYIYAPIFTCKYICICIYIYIYAPICIFCIYISIYLSGHMHVHRTTNFKQRFALLLFFSYVDCYVFVDIVCFIFFCFVLFYFWSRASIINFFCSLCCTC